MIYDVIDGGGKTRATAVDLPLADLLNTLAPIAPKLGTALFVRSRATADDHGDLAATIWADGGITLAEPIRD